MSSLVFSLIVLGACQLCDSVGGDGWGSQPSRYNPFSSVNACTEPDRPTESDPWPIVGEVRRNEFSRDCVSVELKRVFVAADRGFKPGELFAVTGITSRRNGQPFRQLRHTEFVGTTNDKSYRYALSFGADGRLSKISGSIDAGVVSSRLIAASLKAPSQAAVRVLQNVTCDVRQGACEVSRSTDGVGGLRATIVRFERDSAEATLCLEAPLQQPGKAVPAVDLTADGEPIVSHFKAWKSDLGCLDGSSAAAIEKLTRSKKISYSVDRAGDPAHLWDTAEFDADGLAEALALAKFLRESVLISPQGARFAKLSDDANALCKQFPGGTC